MNTLLVPPVHKVRKAFSRAANRYDAFAALHRDIGRKLLDRIPSVLSGGEILDVGMGTGWLTRQLAERFPQAAVTGLDIAEGMIRAAQAQCGRARLLQADAAVLPFHNDVFDLIVSNLAYQWVEDLEAAFHRCYETLKPGGHLCATLFGRETFSELFSSLEHARAVKSGGSPLTLRRLAGYSEVTESVRLGGFEDAVLQRVFRRIRFADLLSLLRWIKSIGANTLGAEMPVGKEWLALAGDYYHAHFSDGKGVFASFEVITVKAQKFG